MADIKKNKSTLGKLFENRKFKYGSYATAVTVIAAVLVVILNIVFSILDTRIGLKLDLTQNRYYTLSPMTHQMLKGLDTDVHAYFLSKPGATETNLRMIRETLSKYEAASPRIKVIHVDPLKNPNIANKFATEGTPVANNSLVIANADDTKYRVINWYDLFEWNQETDPPQQNGYMAERVISSAIMFLTDPNPPAVYFLQGHGELKPSANTKLYTGLVLDNFDVQTINLSKDQTRLKKGDILVIMRPTIDLIESEREQIRDFLADSGRAVFMIDPYKDPLPRFESLLKFFKIELSQEIVVETDAKMYRDPSPINLTPAIAEHEITQPVLQTDKNLSLFRSRAILFNNENDKGVEVQKLLYTSRSAYAKKDFNPAHPQKAAGDAEGPFTVALAYKKVVNERDDELQTRIVVFGSSSLVDISTYGFSAEDAAMYEPQPANYDLFLNSVNWAANRQNRITIRPKSIMSNQLSIQNRSQVNVIMWVVIIIIPVVIMGVGTLIWMRRKHL